ncbi:hypothetical protein BDV98DRAFT_571236 [Pterulicium gracile]|uniref:Secreted protein n=1 Tax=Pterulicium gracile TaxID=1884261 RepID=A0A5C3QDH2_9AGAR|nr:hypothetical protein BDV98DRAFT_571236 [Pterula gracilis]
MGTLLMFMTLLACWSNAHSAPSPACRVGVPNISQIHKIQYSSCLLEVSAFSSDDGASRTDGAGISLRSFSENTGNQHR